jgi:hypothetical protein
MRLCSNMDKIAIQFFPPHRNFTMKTFADCSQTQNLQKCSSSKPYIYTH